MTATNKAAGTARKAAAGQPPGEDAAAPSPAGDTASVLNALLADPESRALLRSALNGETASVPVPEPPATRLPLPPPGPRLPGHAQPVRLSSGTPQPPIVYNVPVFTIDDETYCIPAEPPMWWADEYLDGMADPDHRVNAKAEITMRVRMLGPEGYEALRDYMRRSVISRADYQRIMTMVYTGMTGKPEDDPDAPKGPRG